MSEQPVAAPGIDIPPSVVIDGLRQELAQVKDENSIMRIKIDFLNVTVAALQSTLDQMVSGHSHDDETPHEVNVDLTSDGATNDTPTE